MFSNFCDFSIAVSESNTTKVPCIKLKKKKKFKKFHTLRKSRKTSKKFLFCKNNPVSTEGKSKKVSLVKNCRKSVEKEIEFLKSEENKIPIKKLSCLCAKKKSSDKNIRKSLLWGNRTVFAKPKTKFSKDYANTRKTRNSSENSTLVEVGKQKNKANQHIEDIITQFSHIKRIY